MAIIALPPQERLRKLLDYDPDTGRLIWRALTPDDFEPGKRSRETKARVWNRIYAGKPALNAKKPNGYRCGTVDYAQLLQHRVIWKLMTGDDPDHIDHINGNPADNRWVNLRSVTREVNMRNMKRSKANTSGRTGVSFFKGKWLATGTSGSKSVKLGVFGTFAEADKARQHWEEAREYHPNHGSDR